jgi:cytochrome c biogenesis protein CcmG, thiol:disulfide interchange protein DsbE
VRRLAKAGAVGLLAALIGLLVWQLGHGQEGSQFAAQTRKGEKPSAPAFDLARLDGQGRISLDSLRGKPVVLNFWASWCVGCKVEADALDRLAERWTGKGVSFVGVDSQDLSSDARAFAGRYDVRYPLVHEAGDDTMHRYGVNQLPETYVLDGDGRAVLHIPGAISDQETVAQVESALKRVSGS